MAILDENQNPLIPDIVGITKCVCERLKKCNEYKAILATAKNHLNKDGNCNPTVEDLLSHIRALSVVAGSDKVRGLSAEELETLDREICNLIHQTVNKELPPNQTPYHSVAQWAHSIRREFPVEIFTTNYDLLLEQALEESRVPYFDGFPGVRRPLFDAREIEENTLPPHWTRLWKLHGSINWYENENREVFRGNTSEDGPRRVIHPSHLKYQESRRMPYLAMVDRLREFLKSSTSTLILCGYSFRDDHINETIIQGLQYTQTAVAFALLFENTKNCDSVTKIALNQPNLNVLARNGGVIGGQKVEWLKRDSELASANDSNVVARKQSRSFCDQTRHEAEFKLGDFTVFGQFLQKIVGNVGYSRQAFSNAS